jgi:hypothetical protein
MDDIYVDDCLTGAEDEEEAVKLQQSLTVLMHRAESTQEFTLRKWSSNSEDVLSNVEEKDITKVTELWNRIKNSYRRHSHKRLRPYLHIFACLQF